MGYTLIWPTRTPYSYLKMTTVSVNRGFYTITRRYEFYVRVARTDNAHSWDIVLATRHTDDGVLDNFLRSKDFRPLSEDFRRFSKNFLKAKWTFSGYFRRFPKIAEYFPRRPEDVSIILYFPILHNALCLPPKFCINYCCEMLLGDVHIPKSISQQ